MILTQGEKMVWAAAFAQFRLSGLREISKKGAMTQENNDMVIRQAANAATSAVIDMRALPVEMGEHSEEEVADLYDEDMPQMLRAMLGDEARPVPPAPPAPPPKRVIKEGQSRPRGDE